MTAAALSGDFLVPQGLAMVWGALGVRSCKQETLSIMVQFWRLDCSVAQTQGPAGATLLLLV